MTLKPKIVKKNAKKMQNLLLTQAGMLEFFEACGLNSLYSVSSLEDLRATIQEILFSIIWF